MSQLNDKKSVRQYEIFELSNLGLCNRYNTIDQSSRKSLHTVQVEMFLWCFFKQLMYNYDTKEKAKLQRKGKNLLFVSWPLVPCV